MPEGRDAQSESTGHGSFMHHVPDGSGRRASHAARASCPLSYLPVRTLMVSLNLTQPRRSGLHWGIVWGLWILLLVSVPVTSAPQVAAFLGENTVNPLALIPLAGIALLWFIPYFVGEGRVPSISVPFLAFIALAILSGLAAAALPIYPLKGQDMISREVRAFVTIAISLGFYWSATVIPSTDRDLTASLRAIYLGGILMLTWSTVQAWVYLSGRPGVPLWLTNLHHVLSSRDPLANRVTGFAYEPSWLGDQLVIFYLPLWLGSVLRRFSVFTRARGILSVELMLLGWGMGILLLTRSRISLLSLLLVGLVIYSVGAWRAAGWLISKAAGRIRAFQTERWRRGLRALFEAIALCVLVAAIGGGVLVAGKVDRRLRHLLTLPDLISEIRHYYPGVVGYEVANRLAFAERVIYWADGFRVFEQYPILGVGPGNAGFFFEQSLPDYGRGLTEIVSILRPLNPTFPNVKNLWVRLLAETGVGGFSAFVVWLGLLALAGWRVWRNGSPTRQVIGLAGLLALLAQVGEGFSLDSFALPQLWVILGLLTAAVWRRS